MEKLKNFISKIRKLLNNNFENMLNDQNVKINENNLKTINYLTKLDQKLNTTEMNVNNRIALLERKIDDLCGELSMIQNYNSKRKKVLICGFYGAKNLGDELMLDTLIKKIKILGEYDITIMLSKNYLSDISQYENASVIYFPNKTSDFSILAKQFDCLIFGGGAIIDDENYQSNTEITLGKILVDLTTQFILNNKKTILYGLSTNEVIKDKLYIKKLSYVIDNCSYISLRDKYSYNVLLNLGFNSKKIKVVHDIIFCNDFKDKIKTKHLLEKNNVTIGIIYICFNELESKIENITRNIIKYYEEKNISVTFRFIPFYNYNQNDEKFYQLLIDKLNIKNSIICDFPDNLTDLCNQLNECNYVLSMRYHGTIISNILQIKTMCFNYDSHKHYNNKNKYLFDNYKFCRNIKNLSENFNQSDLNEFINKKNKKIDVKNMCDEANDQIIEALNLIKE